MHFSIIIINQNGKPSNIWVWNFCFEISVHVSFKVISNSNFEKERNRLVIDLNFNAQAPNYTKIFLTTGKLSLLRKWQMSNRRNFSLLITHNSCKQFLNKYFLVFTLFDKNTKFPLQISNSASTGECVNTN